jgi:tRNA(adenine34) deaminase
LLSQKKFKQTIQSKLFLTFVKNHSLEKIFSDEYFMKAAIREAEEAKAKDEVPVGAVVVSKNKIIARAHNLTETLNDPTAHAEMQVITAAASYLGGKYLNDCTVYITLEPCNMCAGALYWSQPSLIVYGASDMKRGYTINNPVSLHPKTNVKRGILENECGLLLKDFFAQKRSKNK